MGELKYYLLSTYRRKLTDKFHAKYEHLYKGIVLDIGGRDRGKFLKPRSKVKKWIFADIEKKHNPEIVLDVADMKQIKTESIDVISAIELFEHVEEIEKGLKECFRVLKKGGTILISIPFLFPVHADPYDFQRWTADKWKKELNNINFKIEKIEIMGRFFTVLCDMKKNFIKSLFIPFRYIGYLFFPFFNQLTDYAESRFERGRYACIESSPIDKFSCIESWKDATYFYSYIARWTPFTTFAKEAVKKIKFIIDSEVVNYKFFEKYELLKITDTIKRPHK